MAAFVRVWEYQVRPADVEAFVSAYGAGGDWAQLFARGTGYLGTDLYRSTSDADRFVTVDRWRSEAHWNAFLAEHRERYAQLDAHWAASTVWEQPLVDPKAS